MQNSLLEFIPCPEVPSPRSRCSLWECCELSSWSGQSTADRQFMVHFEWTITLPKIVLLHTSWSILAMWHIYMVFLRQKKWRYGF